MMTDGELADICRSVRSGAKLLVGSDHYGRLKMKVVKGPFGLMTRRYICEHSDLVRLRSLLRALDVNSTLSAARA